MKYEDCSFPSNVRDARANSSAVFLGKAIETKTTSASTPHLTLRGAGEGATESLVKFQVLRSWKLIDKEYVWIKTLDRALSCGRLEQGETYLVYATELNGSIYIQPTSRTMPAEQDVARADIASLGNEYLKLNDGEFVDHSITLIGFLIVFLIVSLAAAFFTYWLRKSGKSSIASR